MCEMCQRQERYDAVWERTLLKLVRSRVDMCICASPARRSPASYSWAVRMQALPLRFEVRTKDVS